MSGATLLGVTGVTLRPYQREAVSAVRQAWLGGQQRPAVVLPTGAGKTVVFSDLLGDDGAASSGRDLVIAHREELISQAVAKIRMMVGNRRVGVVKAERDQTNHDIVVASVQTLASERRRSRIRDVRRVVVDECHHATADTYMKVLDHYGCFDEGGADAVGFTATMIRGDEKALGDVWPDVVYTKSIAEMIHEGYLVRPRGLRVRVPDLNLRGVSKSAGDYTNSGLGKAIEGSLAPELVAKAYAEHAQDKQGILFAPTVATAQLYAEALRAVGISAEIVSGTTEKGERARILQRFRDGAVQVLCNCMVLTEGTDLPMAEVCVIGRPTLNRGLLIQMCGRVLRLWPGKDSALILDVSGATERHSLLGAIELFGDEGVDVPVDEEQAPEPDVLDELDLELAPTELDEQLDDGPTWLTGEVEAIEVDLFHGSASIWLRTYGGMWFIPTGERYILIQAGTEQGTWDVVRMSTRVGGGSSWVFRGAPDLAYAMAFGEGDVTREEQMLARKEARWRAGRPTEKARVYGRSLGVFLPDNATGGELSSAIAVAKASARIDPHVPAYARRRG